MTLPICQLGDPILRQRAQAVEDSQAPQIQSLIEHMMVTLQAANGVGIAAPQVGQGIQILIIASRPTLRYPHAPHLDPLVVINPQILALSPETTWDWEGCLSLPDQRGVVERANAVAVGYLNRWGQPETAEWQGFPARIFQHEHDHLLGTVFTDHPLQNRMSEAEYLAGLNLV